MTISPTASTRRVSQLPTPVFVHCASGKRSGTLALMHQAFAAGLSGHEMSKQAEAAGASFGTQEQRDGVAAFVDVHSPRSNPSA